MDLTLLVRLLLRREQLRRRDKMQRNELLAFQQRQLAELRRFATANSSFYRKLHAGLESAKLTELPIVTKAQLMADFDNVVTDSRIRREDVQRYLQSNTKGSYLEEYRICATSGSTGTPANFLYNKSEWIDVLASYARANDWAGVKAGITRRLRLAVVSSRNPRHQSYQVGESLHSYFVPTLRLDASDPLDAMIRELESFKPDLLVGYPSLLETLADAAIADRLHFAPVAVMTAAEVLTPGMRSRIEQAWSKRPFDVYGATETAGIASECREGRRMHLYEDLVIPEVVDERGAAVPVGTAGTRLLVTVLFSRTIPLIRYEISDVVTLSGEVCPCGRPFALVAEIAGRIEEQLELPGEKGNVVSIHPNVFHDVFEHFALLGWQVVQDSSESLKVALVLMPGSLSTEIIRTALLQRLSEEGVRLQHLTMETVDRLERGATGKSILVRRFRP